MLCKLPDCCARARMVCMAFITSDCCARNALPRSIGPANVVSQNVQDIRKCDQRLNARIPVLLLGSIEALAAHAEDFGFAEATAPHRRFPADRYWPRALRSVADRDTTRSAQPDCRVDPGSEEEALQRLSEEAADHTAREAVRTEGALTVFTAWSGAPWGRLPYWGEAPYWGDEYCGAPYCCTQRSPLLNVSPAYRNGDARVKNSSNARRSMEHPQSLVALLALSSFGRP